MFTIPNADEVIELAESLGIHLNRDEAEIYLGHLLEQMQVLDAFMQSRLDEERPPLVSAGREPGYRPSRAEDPLNTWTWKCRIDGAAEGILAGKTVGYKDNIAVAGIPMSIGSFALKGFVPDIDATVVTRVLASGGTIIGKHTMDGLSGEDYGRALNPHDRDHVTGGSSSGSGAAVAAGEVDISFGADQGGSIRIPAAWSGTIGLKPTFGLVSNFGMGWGSDQSLDYTGPMARSVEDAAAALQATAGYDGYDPRQGRTIPSALDVVSTLSHGVAGLRIGVLAEGFEDAEHDVVELVMAAVDVLSAAGARVAKVSIPEHRVIPDVQAAMSPEGSRAIFQTGFFGAFTRTYYPASIVAAVNRFWAQQADLLSPFMKLRLITAEFSRRTYYGRVYAKGHNVRPTFVRAFDQALADVDVLVMPTCIMRAPRNDEVTGLDAIKKSLAALSTGLARNTMPFNYTGHPALAVPVGKAGGLPVSMQIVGRFLDDPLLLRVAYAFEQSVDWATISRRAGPSAVGPTGSSPLSPLGNTPQ